MCGQWQSWGRSAGVLLPGRAVPEQNLVTDAYPCLHCTTHLRGWKVHLNMHDNKAMCMSSVFLHSPLGSCVCMWVSLFPRIFLMLRLYRSNSLEVMGEIHFLWEEC